MTRLAQRKVCTYLFHDFIYYCNYLFIYLHLEYTLHIYRHKVLRYQFTRPVRHQYRNDEMLINTAWRLQAKSWNRSKINSLTYKVRGWELLLQMRSSGDISIIPRMERAYPDFNLVLNIYPLIQFCFEYCKSEYIFWEQFMGQF